jgi:hypothetical protein
VDSDAIPVESIAVALTVVIAAALLPALGVLIQLAPTSG